jgi:hypothetical protein
MKLVVRVQGTPDRDVSTVTPLSGFRSLDAVRPSSCPAPTTWAILKLSPPPKEKLAQCNQKCEE